MDRETFASTTAEYYARWLDIDPSAFGVPGVHTVCTRLRDMQIPGYGAAYSLYCWLQGETTVISHSHRISRFAQSLARTFEAGRSDMALDSAQRQFPNLGRGLKFVFRGATARSNRCEAVRLGPSDFPAYEVFFREVHPQVWDLTWLRSYYDSLVRRALIWGVYQGLELASVTDAPGMPFVADRVVEIGINTLERHRGRGFASAAVLAVIDTLLEDGLVPMWSCGLTNEASRRLALSVGFEPLSETLYA